MNSEEKPNPRQDLEDLIEQQGGNSLENCNERVSGLPTRSERGNATSRFSPSSSLSGL